MIVRASEEIEFFKMAGAGNDFIVIDNRRVPIAEAELPELAKMLCRRQLGLGADGLIALETSRVASVRMHYFNADGSRGELCGNGARCAARLAYMRVLAGRKMTIETDAGILHAEILESNEVRVQMPDPVNARENLEVAIGGHVMTGQFVTVGIPHVVFFIKDVDDINVATAGRMVRNHPLFAPAGANVNFAQPVGAGIRLRTYERGVEAETLACGTGAVATAYFAARLFGVVSPIPIAVRSGSVVTVHFNRASGDALTRFELQGDARLLCRGKFTPEALLPAHPVTKA